MNELTRTGPVFKLHALIVYTPPRDTFDALRQFTVRELETEATELQSISHVVPARGDVLDTAFAEGWGAERILRRFFKLALSDISFFFFAGKGSSIFAREVLDYALKMQCEFYDRTGGVGAMSGPLRWSQLYRELQEQRKKGSMERRLESGL